MKVLDYDGLDHSLAKLKVYLDSIRARDLADADDLCYVDPDEGVTVVIDDPGTTGTVLWGAESANQVALSVNGTSKLLLKAAAIAGLESSISTLSGYFINGSARNALSLGGHNAEYFATASGLSALQSAVAGKQDTIVDLASIRSQAAHGETAYGWGNHASAGYATQSWVNGQLNGYAHQVVVNGDAFEALNGTVELPDYPTTLPASDVYPWAKASTKPSYNFSEIGSKPTTLLGYGITDVYFGSGTADSDTIPITLGGIRNNVLIAHQSLVGYVNAILPSAETDVYLCPDCDYFYDPAIGDPIGGIAVGTAFADLPSDWVCPICGASKEDFTAGGRQFVSGVSKSSGSSTVAFTFSRLALRDLSGANNLKAIEYASGSGLLKKNADGAWGFDTNTYLTGITSSMVTTALGYTPFNSANFTQANIQSTLGISNWALAASKPSYAFSELSSHPTTLSGYGITDAAAASDLLSYLPLAGGTMTGQLVVPSLKINGPTTDYAILASLAGTLYVSSDGVLSRPVFDTGNYTSYVYSKAQINTREGVLAAGIAGNSARLDSIEDWILGVNADTVGLGLVENVALSTWAGSGNITTLGTITTGVWNGTNIAANKLAIDFNWVLVGNAATYDTDDHVVVN